MSRRYAVGIQLVSIYLPMQWTDAITGPFGSFGFYSKVRKLKLNTSGGEYLVKRDKGLRKACNFNRYPAMCKLTVGTPTNNQPLLLVATESIYKFSYGSTADSYGRQKLNIFGWKKQSEGAIKQ